MVGEKENLVLFYLGSMKIARKKRCGIWDESDGQ